MLGDSRGHLTQVLVANDVVLSLKRCAEAARNEREQGGLILGLRKPGALHVHSVTFPDRWDVATRTMFQRSERGHRVKALNAWRRSGRKVDWIGEWHTHPGFAACPSATDQSSWCKISFHTAAPMTFFILGVDELFVGIQLPFIPTVRRLQLSEEWEGALLFA